MNIPPKPRPHSGDTSWMSDGACHGNQRALKDLFSHNSETQRLAAEEFCTECPVRIDCLAYGINHRVQFGVWGGQLEAARRKLIENRQQLKAGAA